VDFAVGVAVWDGDGFAGGELGVLLLAISEDDELSLISGEADGADFVVGDIGLALH
jgi:hypothetical protein